MAASVWGADLEFRLAPDGPSVSVLPIKSAFYVVLTDVAGDITPSLFIWDLQKNWSSTVVGPVRKANLIVWGPIQLKRECDPISPGVSQVITADIGDMLVAAVDLQGEETTPVHPESLPPGPSATARVGSPEAAEHTLSVLRGGEEAADLRGGTYTIELSAPDLDRTCSPESVALTIQGPKGKADLELMETGPATGMFSGEITVSYAIQSCSLTAYVGDLEVKPGEEVSFQAAGKDLSMKVAVLSVSLKAMLGDSEVKVLDVGQAFEVKVTPSDYDEVRYCLDGKEVSGVLFLPSPGTHSLTAFVRKGDVWGKTTLELSATGRTVIKPLDLKEEMIEALGCGLIVATKGEKLQFSLLNAEDDPKPVVYVGKLGKGCPNDLKVNKDHTFTVDLADLGAESGDVFWVYYEDPDFALDRALILIRVK